MDDVVEVFELFRIEFTTLYKKLLRELYKDINFQTTDLKTFQAEFDSKSKMASKRLDKFLTGFVTFNRFLEMLRTPDYTVGIFRDFERREILLRFINGFNKLKAFDLDVCFSPLQDDVEDDFSDIMGKMLADSRPLTNWMRAPFSLDRHLP
ncbi:MAG: hypothetical protein KAR03_10805 [Candidatus Thorarchaeota archaeon]|nr:hypothetical protein [Candidatus Thorarchaeota archaeon]